MVLQRLIVIIEGMLIKHNYNENDFNDYSNNDDNSNNSNNCK